MVNMKKFLVYSINFYQKYLSFLFGRNCRFQPTCSCYGVDAIGKYGAGKGLFLLFKRVIKCHPFNKGGVDPV